MKVVDAEVEVTVGAVAVEVSPVMLVCVDVDAVETPVVVPTIVLVADEV